MERLIGGASYSLGLILVVIAWADRKIGMDRLLRNWGLVYIANCAGALMIALMVLSSAVLSRSRWGRRRGGGDRDPGCHGENRLGIS